MTTYSLALDIGATKIAIGIVTDAGEVKSRTHISSKQATLELLNESLRSAIQSQLDLVDHEIVGVGIGSAGPIDPALGTINPVNIDQWRDFPLVDFVRKISQCNNVNLVGDAAALSYAEFVLGAGQSFTNVLGLVVSTGIGGGAVLNKKFHSGATGNASYIGHAVAYPDGELCACGTRGCVEAYSSGPSMARWAQSQGLVNETPDDFVNVAEQARAGNEIAIAAIKRGARALAITLVNAVAVLDLDAVVVGGGVLNAEDVYWPVLVAEFESEVSRLGFPKNCQILRASLGNDSGLVGAGLVGHITVQNGG
jgi:glucokinase